MQEALEAQQEEKLSLEEKYSSADEQVRKMTSKLEKLWHRNEQCQREVQDLQQEFQRERNGLLEDIRDLTKEVKLATLTIEQFIPQDRYQEILNRAFLDETTGEWMIDSMAQNQIDRIELAGSRMRPQRKDEREGPSPSALLFGTCSPPQREPLQPLHPNAYFVYTEDGSAKRAETHPPAKATRTQRAKPAGRPGTASRKGRTAKSN